MMDSIFHCTICNTSRTYGNGIDRFTVLTPLINCSTCDTVTLHRWKHDIPKEHFFTALESLQYRVQARLRRQRQQVHG